MLIGEHMSFADLAALSGRKRKSGIKEPTRADNEDDNDDEDVPAPAPYSAPPRPAAPSPAPVQYSSASLPAPAPYTEPAEAPEATPDVVPTQTGSRQAAVPGEPEPESDEAGVPAPVPVKAAPAIGSTGGFPWFWVVGGLAVVGIGAYFFFRKKKK